MVSRNQMDRLIRWPWLLWAVFNAIGVVLIALPDADNRVMSFSRTHGPAPADLAGSLFLLAGWGVLDWWTWKRRRALLGAGPGRLLWLFAVPAAVGLAIVFWSVSNDAGRWWLGGALVVAAVQVAAAIVAGRRSPAAAGGPG